MRSRIELREAPVRYFVDPSLGTAALKVGSRDLLADLLAAGFHFEAMTVRDLRIYAQPLGGRPYSWRESHGRKEVDAIIDTPDGWAAFEVTLAGDQNEKPPGDHHGGRLWCVAIGSQVAVQSAGC
jgi:hypothetical protein